MAGGRERERSGEGSGMIPAPQGGPVRQWTTANDNELSEHNDEDTLVWWRRNLGAIPLNAQALIEPEPASTNQAGHGRSERWRLRFPMRSKPHVDWLTGWTGGSDPLAAITLAFPDQASAERFCRMQGIHYEIFSPPPAHRAAVNKRTFELDNDRPVTFD